MSRIRVLVVDDAVVVRRIVTEALAGVPDIEVVGTASNGRLGLARVVQLNPDVVTMDVEMPDMNGLDALSALRKTHPRLPVIMFSTLTARGAAATLDALARGASDYVTKPANVGGVSASRDAVRDVLVPKIRALGRKAAPVQTPPPRLVEDNRPPAPVELVVVGVSTGGPNALADVVPALPRGFPAPVLIVQHMPPMFTRLLAERLAARAAVAVREAADGDRPRPGEVLIAPGDRHLEVVRDAGGPRVRLTDGPPENSCRPAADVLFRSAAAAYKAGVLGVVLTGMGQDGLRGSEDIRAAGGRVLAQDEATSVVWGMPGAVARAGLADRVLPLAQIVPEVTRRVRPAARPAVAGVGRG